MIQPDAGGPSVALAEGVGDIHFHVLLHDLVKGPLGHFLNALQGCTEVHERGEAEISLGHIDGAELARETVDVREQMGVDTAEGVKGS